MPIPDVWRRFVERCVPEPPDRAAGTLIAQHGELRLDSGQWAPFTAEQTFDADRCGFLWHARVRMAPMVTAIVEDAFEEGHGRLEARLFGLIPVMEAEPGPPLDRGELIRYLAELAWNPLAIVHNRALHFDVAPSGKPRVWAYDPNSYVDCTFDEHGDLVEIEATTRPRGDRGPTPWSGRFSRYVPIGGVRIPVEAEVSWDPPEGRQVYWRGHVDHFSWRTTPPR